MLTHTAGLPRGENRWDVPDHRPEEDAAALERYVRSLATTKLIHEPNAGFEYSNLGFEILGDVIAKTAGQSFETYMAENILQPLEMSTSTFFRHEVAPHLAAAPHIHAPQPTISPIYPYDRVHAPQSCLHASAAELCNWMIA